MVSKLLVPQDEAMNEHKKAQVISRMVLYLLLLFLFCYFFAWFNG